MILWQYTRKLIIKARLPEQFRLDAKRFSLTQKFQPLMGDGLFWHVSHFEDNLHLYGYINNDDVE